MNRLIGFALVGGFLASSATASAASASLVAREGKASPALPAVQQPPGSVEPPGPAPAAPLAPNTTHRTIHASQAGSRPALPPAAAELAPASQLSPSTCPPTRSDVACRKP